MVLLTVDRIALGVNRLLEFMTDREAVESRRPPIPRGGGHACRNVDSADFGDGMTFQLRIWSRPAPTSADGSIDPVIRQLLGTISSPCLDQASKLNDLEIEIIWHFAELPPQELLLPVGDGPNPELNTFLKDAPHWVLRVSVCEGCYPWISPKSELRAIRSILDQYALPRLILPTQDAAGFRDDFIALIALFATKEQCLAPRDEELARFFRSYCDRFFGAEQKRKRLSEAEWYGVVDRVFLRLYRGKAGMGFTMPAFPGSFRKYVSQAIRCEAAGATSRGRRIPKAGRFPVSINDAAANLGVSHMTVRRHMRRLHFREWTEEAWLAVSAKITKKKQWQEYTAELCKSGLKKNAARKRVQRFKKSGLTLDEARGRNSSAKLRRGTCTACGEQQSLGELYQGKFLCGACYAEKMGISLEE